MIHTLLNNPFLNRDNPQHTENNYQNYRKQYTNTGKVLKICKHSEKRRITLNPTTVCTMSCNHKSVS